MWKCKYVIGYNDVGYPTAFPSSISSQHSKWTVRFFCPNCLFQSKLRLGAVQVLEYIDYRIQSVCYTRKKCVANWEWRRQIGWWRLSTTWRMNLSKQHFKLFYYTRHIHLVFYTVLAEWAMFKECQTNTNKNIFRTLFRLWFEKFSTWQM